MYLVAACTTGFLPSTVRGISWLAIFVIHHQIRIFGWYTTIHFIEVLSTHYGLQRIYERYCWWTKSCTTKNDDCPIIYRGFNVLIIPGGCLGSGQLTSTYPIMPQPRLRDIFVFARRFSPPLRGHVFVPIVRKLSKSGKFSEGASTVPLILGDFFPIKQTCWSKPFSEATFLTSSWF